MNRVSSLIGVLSAASDRFGNPFLTGFMEAYGLRCTMLATEEQLTEYIEKNGIQNKKQEEQTWQRLD